MFRILIVEDDRALSDGICLALQDKEHRLVQAEDLKQAEQILFRENGIGGITEDIDLVILDLNLPDGNGLELLKKLRKYSQLPVIILTANDMEVDIVTGLESGADDYITKPFSLMVLRARVNARLRSIVTEKQNLSHVVLGHHSDFLLKRWSISGMGRKLSSAVQSRNCCGCWYAIVERQYQKNGF